MEKGVSISLLIFCAVVSLGIAVPSGEIQGPKSAPSSPPPPRTSDSEASPSKSSVSRVLGSKSAPSSPPSPRTSDSGASPSTSSGGREPDSRKLKMPVLYERVEMQAFIMRTPSIVTETTILPTALQIVTVVRGTTNLGDAFVVGPNHAMCKANIFNDTSLVDLKIAFSSKSRLPLRGTTKKRYLPVRKLQHPPAPDVRSCVPNVALLSVEGTLPMEDGKGVQKLFKDHFDSRDIKWVGHMMYSPNIARRKQ